jgi:hypothetical protein
MAKFGINGFGRIGRNVFRAMTPEQRKNVVAVNDLTDNKTLAHLLKWDSTAGKLDAEISYDDTSITVDGHTIRVYEERDPAKLPWGDHGVEVVLESTGFFTAREKAELHITSGGAKKVLISAPGKNVDLTMCLGINSDELKPEHFYWNVAAKSGLSVAAVDQPLAPDHPAGGTIEIVGWGTHDRCGFEREPVDSRAARVLERFRDYPIGNCDYINDGSPEGRQQLQAMINDGVDRKTALLADLLETDNWDLFTAVFSEAHCVGHHFWPSALNEPGDVNLAEPGTAVIDQVYSHLDGAVETLTKAAGAGATVIVSDNVEATSRYLNRWRGPSYA